MPAKITDAQFKVLEHLAVSGPALRPHGRPYPKGLNGNVLWHLSDAGLVERVVDGPKTEWRITPKGRWAWTKARSVQAHPK